jgi:hypothetical protein
VEPGNTTVIHIRITRYAGSSSVYYVGTPKRRGRPGTFGYVLVDIHPVFTLSVLLLYGGESRNIGALASTGATKRFSKEKALTGVFM